MADNNNLDMFKLAEEVARQKEKNSVNEDEVIDAIFSSLDSVTRQTDYTVNTDTAAHVIRPVLPRSVGDYTTRYEAYRALVEAVSYGTNNVEEYVNGHKAALNDCSNEVFNKRKNLSIYENELNRKLSEYVTNNDLYKKGYYDGMFYAVKALKRSKEMAMENMAKELRKEL
ncbi:MAG: hypothetical protein Q4D13_07075 [Erysipelotrichaceae bacterium]|nr:hypothetical protein [Erysipelotrichaceae bacterium]